MDPATVLLREAARLRDQRAQHRMQNYAPVAAPDVLEGLRYRFGPEPPPPVHAGDGVTAGGPGRGATAPRGRLPVSDADDGDEEPACRICHCGAELGRMFSPW